VGFSWRKTFKIKQTRKSKCLSAFDVEHTQCLTGYHVFMVSGLDLARAPRRARLTARKKGSGYENGASRYAKCKIFMPIYGRRLTKLFLTTRFQLKVYLSEIHYCIVKSTNFSTIFSILSKKYIKNQKLKIIVLLWQHWRTTRSRAFVQC
jgi:hypothetical protein